MNLWNSRPYCDSELLERNEAVSIRFLFIGGVNLLLSLCEQHPTGGTGTALGTTPPGALAGMGTTLADRDLPSVMTCANYLKLPPYSCRWVIALNRKLYVSLG